jgi:hypothetical protein
MPPVKTETSAAELLRALEAFLAEHPQAAVLEDGRVIFDMRSAHYGLSSEHGRCVLHLWSDERNMVRTIVGLDARKSALRLQARRLGQARPQLLQLVPDRDQRTPTTRTASRTTYLRVLERVMTRYFADFHVGQMRTAMDLEHSFGPAYARGMLVRGNRAWAVIGVGGAETHPTIDGVLTLGILWLAYCRDHSDGRRVIEGLKIIAPAGTTAVTRARMAWLHHDLARWELYELDERSEELTQLDIRDQGNVDVRLVHAFQPEAVIERSRSTVDWVLSLLPDGASRRVEIRPRSATEIGFLLFGLEFARVRHGLAPDSFVRKDYVTFGAGPNETDLTPETQDLFVDLVGRLFQSRHSGGAHRDPLYRLQPERWLESSLREDLAEIEPGIRPEFIYTQVPAFSAGDRGMLDLLTVNRSGRLVVLELKADEDLHLPLQGLDYWLRVRQLQRDGPGVFVHHGYFPGVELSGDPPLLDLVAPALRIHPANETVLRFFSPQVEWTLIALDEHWRERRRVIFRKRRE